MTVDESGDVLSVAVVEPRFTRAEVDVLLASRRKEREPRGPHGFTIAEATDPNVRGRIRVPLPTRDFIQQRIDKEKRSYEKTYGEHAEMGSLYFRAELDE